MAAGRPVVVFGPRIGRHDPFGGLSLNKVSLPVALVMTPWVTGALKGLAFCTGVLW